VSKFNDRLAILDDRKKALLIYMESAINIEDWHGVSDAANDLREVDLELNLSLEGVKYDSQR